MIEDLIKGTGGQAGFGEKAGDLVGMLVQQVQARGGLPDLLKAFHEGGTGEKADSSVGTGENVEPTPDKTQAAIGGDFIAQAAAHLGLDPAVVGGAASKIPPGLIDRATPNGQVEEGADLMGAPKGLAGGGDLGGLGKVLGG